ncbi:hypothetical protein K0U83_11495 [bacterium]|nr:hypothetical protein [bacterium]
MKYAQLLQKFKAGEIEDTDLEGVSAEDWLQVRLDAGEGLLQYALSDVDLGKGGKKDDEEEMGRGKRYSYVMVSDELIPPLKDKVMANAWDLREFKYRGSNVLYDHNIQESRPPIGRAENLQKGVELKKGGSNFKALTGDVSFADRDTYEFAGLVEDLVSQKLLSNGSVGFDVMKMRAPTDDEQETMGMKPFSAVIQKANLIEFSITPLGRDKNARLLSADGTDLLEAKLAEFAEAGIHSDDVLGEFRETLSQSAGEPTRIQVAMPDPVEPKAAPEPEEATVEETSLMLELDALKSEILLLRDEVRSMRAVETEREPDLYETLYEELLAPSPERTESATGDDPADIYSLARDLGF